MKTQQKPILIISFNPTEDQLFPFIVSKTKIPKQNNTTKYV